MRTLIQRLGVACLALLLSAGLAHAVDIDLRNADGTKNPLTDSGTAGAADVSLKTCVSGESACIVTSPSSYLMVAPAVPRVTVPVTAVTTNTTSATFTLPSGAKTLTGKVEGTGAVTQTQTLFCAYDSTAANGVSLATVTLSGTTKDVKNGSVQVTTDCPFYYVTTTNTTGTGAAGELTIENGLVASGSSGGGGAVTNAGTFAVQANVTAINSVTPLMGAGNTGTGSQRVTEATDSQLSAGVGATGDALVLPGATGSLSAKLRGLATDPCGSAAKTYVTISQTTGTQLFTGTASMRTYVCSINIVTATTQNITLVSGTGTVCATGTGAMAGGTTAATGWNFVANQGIVMGDGKGAIMKSKVDADNICILMSSTGQLSGVISYVAAAN